MVTYKHLTLLFVFDCWHHGRAIDDENGIEPELKEGSPCVAEESERIMNGTCVSLFKCTSAAQASIETKAGFEHKWPPIYVCSYKENGEPVVCCMDCDLNNRESLKGYVAMQNNILYPDTGPKAWQKCIEYYSTLPYPGPQSVHWESTYSNTWNERRKCIGKPDPPMNVHYSQYPSRRPFFGVRGTVITTSNREMLCQGQGNSGYAGYTAHRDYAQPDELPHMALLGYGPGRDSAQWVCGGSIISERFLLSAAHCSSASKLGNVRFAALGILKRTELNNYWSIYKIKTIIKHPEYRPPSKYHDIMLLETATDINFGRSVLPACLYTGIDDSSVMDAGYQLSATGWGRESATGPLAEHLQSFHLFRYNESSCFELFPPHRVIKTGYDATTQMCYGGIGEVVDTCKGDSGGPLHQKLSEGYFHIHGITSFGKDCGIPGNAGMYTRVQYYVPWIESIVWKDE